MTQSNFTIDNLNTAVESLRMPKQFYAYQAVKNAIINGESIIKPVRVYSRSQDDQSSYVRNILNAMGVKFNEYNVAPRGGVAGKRIQIK